MTIVFLDQSGQLGGAELMLLDLIPKLNMEARVILLEEGPFQMALKELGIATHIIKHQLGGGLTKRAGIAALLRAIPGTWKTIRQVANLARDTDARVLYANTAKAWIIGAIVSARTGVRLVCHLHDIISARHFSRMNRLLLVQAANRVASAVIANSTASAEAFVAAGGKKQLVTVIPNGFNIDALPDWSDSRGGALRVELGLDDTPLAAMIGRLSPWKGQHVFIEAVARIPGVHGVIAGEAMFTDDDRTYAANLPRLARSLGCSERIHFLGFRRNILPVIEAADIVTHCSVEPEPFGRVIVEAMLCGKPVVVSGEGGAAEIVENGVTGLHHTPGNAASLATALQRYLDNPEATRSIAIAGRQTAREHYTLPRIAARTEELLVSVANATSFRLSSLPSEQTIR